jgi:hypothetical protein
VSIPPHHRTCSALLSSDLLGEKTLEIKRKTWYFCFFEIKMATPGVSLCYFHACMYYNPIGSFLLALFTPP